jgi:hypothetical protein
MKINVTLEACNDEREHLEDVVRMLQSMIHYIVDESREHLIEHYNVPSDIAEFMVFESGIVALHSYPWNRGEGPK